MPNTKWDGFEAPTIDNISTTVAYRGVNACVRINWDEAREMSAAGAIFLQGVWGRHRPPAGPGQSPVRGFRGRSPPTEKDFSLLVK